MKSSVNITTPLQEFPDVPYLTKHKASGMILLVTSQVIAREQVVGVVIQAGSNSQKLGTNDHAWSVLMLPNDWETLPNGSTVTLTQDF
jgi:hypothetical protein